MPRPKLPPAEKKTQRSIILPPDCWEYIDAIGSGGRASDSIEIERLVRGEMESKSNEKEGKTEG